MVHPNGYIKEEVVEQKTTWVTLATLWVLQPLMQIRLQDFPAIIRLAECTFAARPQVAGLKDCIRKKCMS